MKTAKLIISIVAVACVATFVFVMAEPSPTTSVGAVKITDSTLPNSTSDTSSNAPVVPKTPTVPASDVPSSTKKSTKYKNGTYSLTASYESPAGPEDMGVSVTLKGDIVTASTFTPMANDGRSSRYQSGFASAYKSYVVGKNIDSISLDAVSGASLTSAGFNDALTQIKASALN